MVGEYVINIEPPKAINDCSQKNILITRIGILISYAKIKEKSKEKLDFIVQKANEAIRLIKEACSDRREGREGNDQNSSKYIDRKQPTQIYDEFELLFNKTIIPKIELYDERLGPTVREKQNIQRIYDLELEINRLTAENARLNQEVENGRRTIEQNNTRIQRLRNEVIDLQGRLNASQTEIARLTAELARVNAENTRLVAENARLNTLIVQLQQQNNQFQNTIRQNELLINQLRRNALLRVARIIRLQEANNRLTNVNQQLTNQLHESDELINQLLDNIERIDQLLADSNNRNLNMVNIINAMNQYIAGLQQYGRDQINAFNQYIDQVNQQFQQNQDIMRNNYQNNIDFLGRVIAILAGRIRLLQADAANNQATIARYQNQIQHINDQIRQLNQFVAIVPLVIHHLNQQNADILQQAQDQKDIIQQGDEQNQRDQRELVDLREAKTTLELQVGNMMQVMADQKTELDNANNALAAEKQKVTALSALNETLEKTNEELKATNTTMTEANKQLDDKNKALVELNNTLEAQIKEMMDEGNESKDKDRNIVIPDESKELEKQIEDLNNQIGDLRELFNNPIAPETSIDKLKYVQNRLLALDNLIRRYFERDFNEEYNTDNVRDQGQLATRIMYLIDLYNRTIQSKENTIKQIMDGNAAILKNMQEEKDANVELITRNASLTKELSKTRAENTALEIELKNKNESIGSLSSKNNALIIQLQKMRETIAENRTLLDNQNKTYERLIGESKEKLRRLQAEQYNQLEELKEENDKLTRELAKFTSQADYDHLTEELRKTREALRNLKQSRRDEFVGKYVEVTKYINDDQNIANNIRYNDDKVENLVKVSALIEDLKKIFDNTDNVDSIQDMYVDLDTIFTLFNKLLEDLFRLSIIDTPERSSGQYEHLKNSIRAFVITIKGYGSLKNYRIEHKESSGDSKEGGSINSDISLLPAAIIALFSFKTLLVLIVIFLVYLLFKELLKFDSPKQVKYIDYSSG